MSCIRRCLVWLDGLLLGCIETFALMAQTVSAIFAIGELAHRPVVRDADIIIYYTAVHSGISVIWFIVFLFHYARFLREAPEHMHWPSLSLCLYVIFTVFLTTLVWIFYSDWGSTAISLFSASRFNVSATNVMTALQWQAIQILELVLFVLLMSLYPRSLGARRMAALLYSKASASAPAPPFSTDGDTQPLLSRNNSRAAAHQRRRV